MQTYILPKFKNTDITNIKFSHLALKKQYHSSMKFALKNGIDTRYPELPTKGF